VSYIRKKKFGRLDTHAESFTHCGVGHVRISPKADKVMAREPDLPKPGEVTDHHTTG
jgi:hypothetical protein